MQWHYIISTIIIGVVVFPVVIFTGNKFRINATLAMVIGIVITLSLQQVYKSYSSKDSSEQYVDEQL